MKGFKNAVKLNKISRRKDEIGRNVKKIINQATQLYLNKRFKDSEKVLIEGIRINNNYYPFYFLLGAIYFQQGKLEEAENFTKKCLALNSNIGEAYSNLASIKKSKGQYDEAEKAARKAIKLDPKSAISYLNLGAILIELNQLKDALIYLNKSLELDKNTAETYLNIGIVLKGLNKPTEAEDFFRKSIKLSPNNSYSLCALGEFLINKGDLKDAKNILIESIKINKNKYNAYLALSNISDLSDLPEIRKNLFSFDLSTLVSFADRVNIAFARANINHKEKDFNSSRKNLEIANHARNKMHPSLHEKLISESENLKILANKLPYLKEENVRKSDYVFIVGMPRSGSTLVDSILNLNPNAIGIGESSFLKESFIRSSLNSLNPNVKTICDIYTEKVISEVSNKKTIIDKQLHNYIFTGIILKQFPNAKIIHCIRNPLDNILSIFRSNFKSAYLYESSLVNSTRVYINQDRIMSSYKSESQSRIYTLNYDELVKNPTENIKDLILWLGFKWDLSYTMPNKTKRYINTCSNVQIRSEINQRSLNGWNNYREMLKPAIEILSNYKKYNDFISY